jgi:hypothetical protein
VCFSAKFFWDGTRVGLSEAAGRYVHAGNAADWLHGSCVFILAIGNFKKSQPHQTRLADTDDE